MGWNLNDLLFRNTVIAAARSNGIHQRKIGYKYDQSKWGLYKRMQPTVIQNDYISAIWFTANPQHQMCSIKLWAVRALAGLKLSILSGTNIDCAVYVSAFSAAKKKLRKHAAVCVYAQSEQAYVFSSRDFTVCMCAWLAGPENRHWAGRVEGLHRLRLLTQFWQNWTPRAPRNPAGGAQHCNPIPSVQHGAVKNARRRTCQGHGSICSYSSARAFLNILGFFLLPSNNQL